MAFTTPLINFNAFAKSPLLYYFIGKIPLLLCFLLLSACFGSVSALADQNFVKKGGILHNGGGLHNDDCAKAIDSLSGAILGRGDQKWMKNDLFPLNWKRARA